MFLGNASGWYGVGVRVVDTRDGSGAVRAYTNTKEICYPRYVGTLGERRAARLIRRHFRASGLDVARQRFRVSLFPALIGETIIFVGCLVLVLASARLFSQWPLVGALSCALATWLVNFPWSMSNMLGRRWPPYRYTQNLLATLPSLSYSPPARVVFMAHYDTKSQRLPTGLRVTLVVVTTLVCGCLSCLGVVKSLGVAIPAQMTLAGAVAAALCLGGLACNQIGNRSPGALDNGSAVGTLLELARSWRPLSEAPVDVVWIATAAEEVGLCGARHFLRQCRSWWQEKPTLLINLESVGVGDHVYLAGEPNALRFAEATADELGVRHARLRILGAGMDHEPFAARHLASVSILGDVVSASLVMHSRRDDMQIIQLPALERAGRLAAHLAWRWAEMHQPAKGRSEAIASLS